MWSGRNADEKHAGTTLVETETTLVHTRRYVGYLTPIGPYGKVTDVSALKHDITKYRVVRMF